MKLNKEAIICALIGVLVLGVSLRPSSENPMEKIFREVSQQTVLLTDPAGAKGGGTGFVIKTPTGRRYTMTNAHVCGLAENNYLRAVTPDSAEYHLTVISVARDRDLCILDAVPGKEGLTLSSTLTKGQTVYIVGHPHLLPNTPSSGLYTYQDNVEILDEAHENESDCTAAGGHWVGFQTFFGEMHVCAQTRNADFTNASIYPGNSGSPVTNEDGFVVGVVFAGNGVLGYFVPRELVEDFLNKF